MRKIERPIERRKREAHYRELVKQAEGPDAKANLIALANLEKRAAKATKMISIAVEAVAKFYEELERQEPAIEMDQFRRIFGDFLADDLEAETKDNLCQADALQSRIQDALAGRSE